MEKKYRKRPTTIYEEALQKVKHNTAQRKEALKRLDAPQSDLVDPSSSSLLNQELLNTDQQQTCFICNETLFGDSEAINLHIDRCLMNMNEQPTTTSHNNNNNNNLSPQDGNDWDQYEWAGQVRVRATSMMEGGYGGAGFATAQKEDDVDEDLDIEEDDAEYGHSQYNERDIMVNMDEDNDDSNALREMISEASPQSGFEETVSDAGWDRHLAMDHPSSSEISQSTTGNLVVDSLKSRIHQLEMASRSVPRCLICLEPYKTPLTSIICWHVHCEQCWLQTLGSKKLCPQCQKITTPSDLRRIYL
ncbi:uncharacterized protein BX664DRAFT_266699 [Halteromyces radiatus]|uniref:uncharacterized protein n=1 Tax=Halteromyces radiatus TaxID=101107 RepID=UPI00221EEDEA|nr:uncharacterized protein BX664DRAFT_266699 [Halteromyces radiatus]KAI8084731.1 hypothetical protein BX664DRAFT_266699 [Halteromyces radiatus]